ncbi:MULTISPECIES: NAD(P)-dependent oxidoreductase [Ramlibacter]|uniref:NAD-binding protein n=1 Tax=Ramlibacter pinisoli TaxID=2682844 RepID=A0A6N8IVI5_9BURK|nr:MULTISPECIES: NAD(P)-dependent oxidoreductase [Ramlibacter]MBA2965175.1 NAD(P)-dependent oxidoreductase [Ramlibacter sp. CGMCC 1.13660]MVQ30140.1 NAD-binding protein [Ramlibacter pinisoli]
MQVHVVGAGKMGLPMAVHLRVGGHAVTVDDLQPERLALAREAGLPVRQGPDALAAADVVLSSLPHDGALLAVAAQVASHASRGTVYIDTSTVSQEASAQAARLLQPAGVQYLRTTVSGNNKMAEAAQLTVMASGPRATHQAMLPLLQLLGPQQFWLGEGEQARLMKLVVNLMIAQTSAMLAEALALGRKGGLRWDDLWAVIGASAVGSPIVKAKGVQLVQRDFTPTFTVEQMLKDLNLIVDAAAASHVPVPQTAATLQLMHAAIAQGDGSADYAAIIKAVERAAGLGDPP